MRTIVLPIATAALLAATSFAFAASATGTIATIDQSNNAITLDNGEMFTVAPSVSLSSLKQGEKVKVTYTEANGKMQASDVTPES